MILLTLGEIEFDVGSAYVTFENDETVESIIKQMDELKIGDRKVEKSLIICVLKIFIGSLLESSKRPSKRGRKRRLEKYFLIYLKIISFHFSFTLPLSPEKSKKRNLKSIFFKFSCQR